VAWYFLQKGYSKVFIIEGGWNAWQHAGYPVEKK
jgi:3-mercaptopyruvate sulfurtransferase SseA